MENAYTETPSLLKIYTRNSLLNILPPCSLVKVLLTCGWTLMADKFGATGLWDWPVAV